MADLRKNVKIDTHENVAIEYETANVGSRFLARLIDSAIIYGSIFVFIIITVLLLVFDVIRSVPADYDDGPDLSILTIIGIFIIIIFIINYTYYVFFEMLLHGQSPGKKAVGIKVVSVTGEPETLIMSIIRNLFRLADVLPTGYFLGAFFVTFNKRSQRLGDIVANTMVVKISKNKKFKKLLDTLLRDEAAETELLAETDNIQSVSAEENGLSAITEEELEILKKYLSERKNIRRNNELDIKLFNYFFRKSGATPPKVFYLSSVLPFLEQLAANDGKLPELYKGFTETKHGE